MPYNAANQRPLSLLEKLSTELLQGPIADHLSDQEKARLSRTSKTMFFIYKEPLEIKAAKKLLDHVIKGEEKEALGMINNNPHLLLVYSQARHIDHSGRFYNRITCFQAALRNHDVRLWREMEHRFVELPDGMKEKAKQFKQLFPTGLPEQRSYDFKTLVQVISSSLDVDIDAALRKESNDTPIGITLKTFRESFTALAMQETLFNPLHLIEAFKIYQTKFNSWSSNQRDLFWRQVIGYIQRFLPACYAQAFCQGLYSIVTGKKPLVRSLKFNFDAGSYYPLTETSPLGFRVAILPCSMPRMVAESASRGPWHGELETLCQSNAAELLRLERRIRHNAQPRSSCTIS